MSDTPNSPDLLGADPFDSGLLAPAPADPQAVSDPAPSAPVDLFAADPFDMGLLSSPGSAPAATQDAPAQAGSPAPGSSALDPADLLGGAPAPSSPSPPEVSPTAAYSPEPAVNEPAPPADLLGGGDLVPVSPEANITKRATGSLPLTTGQDFMEFVDLKPDLLDYSLSLELGLETCRRLGVVPVEADPVEIVIAVTDASDLILLDDIRARCAPREVRFVAADPDAMLQVIARWSVIAAKEAEADVVRDLSAETSTSGDSEASEATDDNGKMAQLVARLLEQAVTAGASDVHFEPGETRMYVRFRIDGVLTPHDSYPMSLATGIVNRLKVMSKVEISERRIPQDGRFNRSLAGREVDCRVVTLPVSAGVEGAVVRLLDQSRARVPLDAVGFSPHVYSKFVEVLANPYGMVLVTGPTGSGKTTSLYAALGSVAKDDRKVLTVEDPVEIRFPQVTQVQVNEKAGLTFAAALRSFLRADPDTILVGEIRDKETAALAAQAALTGHLVLSTLHTNEASGAPTRLVNMGLDGFVIASALKAVLAQRLLRRLCKRCAEPYEPTSAELEQLDWASSGFPVPSQLWRPSGVPCDTCSSRGYRGRVVAAEMVVVTDALAEAISSVTPSGELERLARAEGTVPIHTDALGWVAAGETSAEEVLRVGA